MLTPAVLRRVRRALCPVTIVLVSLAVQLSPPAQGALELDRAAAADGQAWRLVTGQVTHFGWSQLAADVGAFIALCWLARRQPWLGRTVLVSLLAVGLGVQLGAGHIQMYRGLSGVNYALMAWLLMHRIAESLGWGRAAFAIVLAAMVGKSVLEVLGLRLPLPVPLPEGVAVVGWAHLAGLMGGAGMWAVAGVAGGSG
jgi:rhomboid family GlyGly-CTERM serine protease